MTFSKTSLLYLLLLTGMPICFIVGHLGAESLSWKHDPVSTYAAQAPQAHWITVGMVLGILSLLFIGDLLDRLISNRWISNRLSNLYSLSAGGLLLLTVYEETVPTGYSYRQGFHDVGLILFSVTAILSIAFTGLTLLIMETGWKRRLTASLLLLFPIGAILSRNAMFDSKLVGMYQRGAFLCFGLSLCVLFLLVITKKNND